MPIRPFTAHNEGLSDPKIALEVFKVVFKENDIDIIIMTLEKTLKIYKEKKDGQESNR